MNIYNTQQIKCSICGRFIGELDKGSVIIFPLCKTCNKKEKKIIRKGINKILVPVDITKKSTKALDVAIYLSRHLGSSITLMYSIPNITMGRTSLIVDTIKQLREEATESISQAKIYCSKKNVVANHRITRGDEAEQIIKIAKKSDYDLIVMGSSGKGALKEMIFGSISNYVFHNSDIPVLTVKETSAKLDTKISRPKKNNSKNKNKQKPARQGRGVSFSKMKKRAGLE